MNCMPSVIDGEIKAPSSKSYMQRALAASLLSAGKVLISNTSVCSDSLSSMRVARGLGAIITRSEDSLTVEGAFQSEAKLLNCGESGLCIRMFTPIAALLEKEISLTAEGSLKFRPMTSIAETLSLLGADCSTSGGRAPIKVKGPLSGGKAYLDSSQTSQFLTGLLMALPLAKKDSILIVKNLSSIPYVNMTLDVLKRSEIEINWDGNEEFKIPGRQHYNLTDYRIEGDWSGAAFALVAAAIAGSVTVSGLNIGSLQADRCVLDVLKTAGADVKITEGKISVTSKENKPFCFDVSQCPDLAPPLAVLAAFSTGTSRINGIDRLPFKECNRAVVLTEELGKIGVDIRNTGASLEIRGKAEPPEGGTAHSRGDHRIAMALAVAALGSRKGISIEEADSVSKSYPAFFQDLSSLGADIHE